MFASAGSSSTMLSLPLELDFVESLVAEHFGIAAQAVRLTGDRDENFRMQVKDAVVTAAPKSDSTTPVAR